MTFYVTFIVFKVCSNNGKEKQIISQRALIFCNTGRDILKKGRPRFDVQLSRSQVMHKTAHVSGIRPNDIESTQMITNLTSQKQTLSIYAKA